MTGVQRCQPNIDDQLRALYATHPICVEAADEITALKARVAKLEGALQFYRDEWQMNGDGDTETPGLSRSWMEPTDALHNDEGRKAAAALQPKAGS